MSCLEPRPQNVRFKRTDAHVYTATSEGSAAAQKYLLSARDFADLRPALAGGAISANTARPIESGRGLAARLMQDAEAVHRFGPVGPQGEGTRMAAQPQLFVNDPPK